MLGPLPLFSLIYQSQAHADLREGALTALLHRARLYNQAARLTGLLLYRQRQFLQVLEGPEPALNDLYARIQADPRHHDVRTLAYGPIEARSFPDWRMGFAAAAETLLGQATGFLPLSAAPGLAGHPPEALTRLLRDFAQGRTLDE